MPGPALPLLVLFALQSSSLTPQVPIPEPCSGNCAVIYGGLGLTYEVLSGAWLGPPSSPSGASTRNDGRSVNVLVSALYDSVSHGPNSPPDWKRMRALFLPGAIIVPAARPNQKHPPALSVKAFQQQSDRAIHAMKQAGRPTAVLEKEIARQSSCFGTACSIFSTYEARHVPSDPKPFARGINSIQVVGNGQRWWIASITWDTERPDNPIPGDPPAPAVTVPPEYLKKN